MTKGVLGNALKFSHLEEPGDVVRTPVALSKCSHRQTEYSLWRCLLNRDEMEGLQQQPQPTLFLLLRNINDNPRVITGGT